MRRMTCENRLVFVAAIGLGLVVTSARGGSLDAPAAPTNEASAMWTLENIYNVLDTRTTNVTKRTDVFAEPMNGPTSGTMRTLNDIMTLVTNRAPVPKTGQTNSYLPGDDGWYSTNVGVAWPNPRFITNNINAAGTNVVTDKLTGLMWTRNANLPNGTKNWTNAISYCTNMNNGSGTYGYTDWRLPNVKELFSLVDCSQNSPSVTTNTPFVNVQVNSYWTSTAYLDAWNLLVYFVQGRVSYNTKATVYYVWPVRGGQ